MFDTFPKTVSFVEVGPRDGLQNEKEIISLDDKITYIEKLIEAGHEAIEVTSFVRPDAIPQMGDATELYSKLSSLNNTNNVRFLCLVPNITGYQAAKACGVKEIALFSATSNSFTKKNINCTVDESFERMEEVIKLAKADGVKIRAYISTAFGCPYEGDMSKEALLDVIQKFIAYNIEDISIGDTIGVATPKQVDEYLSFILEKVDKKKIAMHFHDTRGMALSNILISLKHGITNYDSSSGGLGGCPYANGATGNVATEDLVYLFDSLNIKHNLDEGKLIEASKFILKKVNKESPSKYFQAKTK
ncbi:MAG: hydroxymethylglutaryl-CoA lyase [Bacteriovoracaceae bacterium]